MHENDAKILIGKLVTFFLEDFAKTGRVINVSDSAVTLKNNEGRISILNLSEIKSAMELRE